MPDISSQIQDPLVLLDPVCLRETLLEWLPVLERILGPTENRPAADSNVEGAVEEEWDRECLNSEQEESSCSSKEPTEEKEESHELEGKEDSCEPDYTEELSNGSPREPVRVVSPKPLQPDLLVNLTQLATLYTELSCFRRPEGTTFLRRYFFLLDQERVRRMCLLCYQEQPEVQSSFIEAMLGQELKTLQSVTQLLFFPPCFILTFQISQKQEENDNNYNKTTH